MATNLRQPRPALEGSRALPRAGEAGATLGRLTGGVAFALLLTALLFAPLAHGSLYPWSLFGFRALVALALGFAGVAAALRGRLHLPPAGLTVMLGGFLLLTTLSAYLNPNPFGTGQALLTTLSQAAGFVLVFALARGPRRRYAVVAALLVGAAAMGVYGAAQALGYGFTATLFDAAPPVSSSYYNRNHYAGYLDLVTLTALGLALFGPSWWLRLGSGGLALLLYVNLGLTFSDGGWVATGLATLALLCFWAFRAPARARRTRTGVLVLLLLVGGGGAGTFLYRSPELSGTLHEKVQGVLGRTAQGERHYTGLGSIYSRLAIYRATLRIIGEHPLLGVGPGGFIYELPKWRPVTATGGFVNAQLHSFVNYAHNDYLQVASEAGVPAAALFVLFWLLVLRRALVGSRALVGAGFGLAALLLHGLVDGNLTINPAAAFLAFAVAGLLYAHPDAEESTGQQVA